MTTNDGLRGALWADDPLRARLVEITDSAEWEEFYEILDAITARAALEAASPAPVDGAVCKCGHAKRRHAIGGPNVGAGYCRDCDGYCEFGPAPVDGDFGRTCDSCEESIDETEGDALYRWYAQDGSILNLCEDCFGKSFAWLWDKARGAAPVEGDAS